MEFQIPLFMKKKRVTPKSKKNIIIYDLSINIDLEKLSKKEQLRNRNN